MKPDRAMDHQARRMMSAAMYRKLRGVVAGWEREERLKSSAAGVSGFLLLALAGVALAAYAVSPAWTLPVIVYGTVLWLVVLIGLTVELVLPERRARLDR